MKHFLCSERNSEPRACRLEKGSTSSTYTAMRDLALGLAISHLAANQVAADPFIMVALPDTQIYSQNRFPDGQLPAVTDPRGTGAIFFDQTQWIVEGAANIDYVAHLGDIVQRGENLTEWALAKDAMQALLDADIPHGTVMGNHDDIPPSLVAAHGVDYRDNYLTNFGPEVFEGRSWYAGSSPEGAANWQQLEHDGYKLGFLNFSIDHPELELEWAEEILTANPDTIFIIGTHRYLYDFKLVGGRYGEDVNSILGNINIPQGAISSVDQPNSGEEFFEKLVSQHSNILMVHAGHFHSEWLRLDGRTPDDQPIIQILTDYQSTRNGGDGWLRKYYLDFEAGTFSYDTFSPLFDRKRTTIDHFVETIYLTWAERDNVKQVLGIESDEVYFEALNLLLKDTPAPDGFLLEHPDLDDPLEQAYYLQYLNDLFLGDIPDGYENILEWENLWLSAFAADPGNPFDFSDGPRSPSYTLDIDYSAYFTPGLPPGC
ncbi:MAG: hypothetical protein Hals2KO_31180 [Halioglobus sp.]